ncbi:hypothetical protein PRIPAC_83820 [Pristionchus pacificus]|uniref:Uncharacterized protein n=1 Tax=Pristionchus pacificus TaxID=54126 RepID=A0A2A6BN37_PRIPA|nr:hypothetical protein PRIPAC_83820 [Pristionchus pacificus]|eukprot:PDM67324.1 hypothetical protein PRIPAC_48741 [Pristionchus pacificus]
MALKEKNLHIFRALASNRLHSLRSLVDYFAADRVGIVLGSWGRGRAEKRWDGATQCQGLAAMAAGDPIDRPFLRDVDQWMEQLYDCKQLSEQQVKMLFEQVRNAVEKLAEYLKTSGY